jgi:hypothetical protein
VIIFATVNLYFQKLNIKVSDILSPLETVEIIKSLYSGKNRPDNGGNKHLRNFVQD